AHLAIILLKASFCPTEYNVIIVHIEPSFLRSMPLHKVQIYNLSKFNIKLTFAFFRLQILANLRNSLYNELIKLLFDTL
ncbi:MAG: hypothetical protein KBS74_07445, partial [Clostridiales bacterium]|nr:hypothetical protein [Candidatus Cacconaster stercorequi]